MKKLKRKLSLNKETIAKLDQGKVYGGRTDPCSNYCSNPCPCDLTVLTETCTIAYDTCWNTCWETCPDTCEGA